MKKAQKFAQNNATEWKARGFKNSDASTTESAGSSFEVANNQDHGRFQNSFGFNADSRRGAKSTFNSGKSRRPVEQKEEHGHIEGEDDHAFNSPVQKKKLKPCKEIEEPSIHQDYSASQPNEDTPASVKPQKKKKTKNVAGSEMTGDAEANEESGKRKKQKFQGYTLFIGNLSYDTTKEDVLRHFAKCGTIKNVRIPLEKETNQPRGFGYIEVEEHVTYENVLSMHHTFLARRRINVECTFGGSKTSQKRMALIKEKTLKLRFLSREGKISSAKQRPWGKFNQNQSFDTPWAVPDGHVVRLASRFGTVSFLDTGKLKQHLQDVEWLRV